MAEQSHSYAHEIQKKAMDIDDKYLETSGRYFSKGQIFGFIIALFTVGCGTYAAVSGAEIAGSLIGTGGVASLVAVFIHGRKSSS